MKETPLYTNIEGEVDDISTQVIGAIQDFGREILDRDFKPTAWDSKLPRIRDYKVDGAIKPEAYKLDLNKVYDANKDKDIFTVDVVDTPLDTRMYLRVFATSWQHHDLKNSKNTELVTPNKSSVIISRDSFDSRVEGEYNQARAYALGFHEIGHLVLGDKVCKSDECIFSHNYGSLTSIVNNLLEGKPLPICGWDKERIEEFKKNERRNI